MLGMADVVVVSRAKVYCFQVRLMSGFYYVLYFSIEVETSDIV